MKKVLCLLVTLALTVPALTQEGATQETKAQESTPQQAAPPAAAATPAAPSEPAKPAPAGEEEGKAVDRLKAAGDVLEEIQSAPDQGIPEESLGSAECVAVVPSLLKG